MKLKMFVVLSALVAAAAVIGTACRNSPANESVSNSGEKILYYTCPMHPSVRSDTAGNCPTCGMALQPVYAKDVATNSAPTAGDKPVPYPLDICIVSGERLGEMGAPVEFVYAANGVNQEIKFCCPNCKAKFLKDPDTHLKKIQAAQAAK